MKILQKIVKLLFSRMTIVAMLIAAQIVFLVLAIWKLGEIFVYIYSFFTVLSLLVVVYIISKKDNPSYKLAWVIPILTFPLFGGFFYLIFGGDKPSKRFRKNLNHAYTVSSNIMHQDPRIYESLLKQDKSAAMQTRYIWNYGGFPVYGNTATEYLTPGEKKFERLLTELKKAEHFIFLEYFIIQPGIMWDSILNILIEKVAKGVDVRLVYDDVGCLQTLPYKYYLTLRSMGIKCEVFNKFEPVLSIRMNNRDHRKIVVIDGHTGFTGGINLADEYINAYEKYGYWKDASIMIQGEAVWNLTVMFLQTWIFCTGMEEDFTQYMPQHFCQEEFLSDGYVMPFGDTPFDDESVSEYVYLNMINKAHSYLYINTPYLITDNEVLTALCLAAKSGVDIRIVTPGKPDKWYVHMVSQAYYQPLIESGVRIYEYTPGFMHSKTFVSDDATAIVGTINLDFRSLYLHFECGVWMYHSQAVMQVKEDFLKTLEICREITIMDCKKVSILKRFVRIILRAFAPLM